jgi:hypothetical protein
LTETTKKKPVASRGARDSREQVTDKQARKTALVVATVFFLVAAWNIYRGRTTVVAIFGGAALLLVVIGYLVPVAARGFHRVWMGIAHVLGYVNSRILLSFLYYVVFTPYGLISRLMRRDPLTRRGPDQESYWIKREYTRQTKEQFERLF